MALARRNPRAGIRHPDGPPDLARLDRRPRTRSPDERLRRRASQPSPAAARLVRPHRPPQRRAESKPPHPRTGRRGAHRPPRHRPRAGPRRPPPTVAEPHNGYPSQGRHSPPCCPPLIPRERTPATISLDPTAHREFLRHLKGFIRDSKEILDAWDAYSEEHTDLSGWPHDDHAYGLRQSQRDADTAEAFESIRAGARHLLTTADTQLAHLPTHAVQNRWGYQLGVLHTALDRLDALHEQWLRTREDLPAKARPGTPAFDDALAEHHAASWSYLDDWATHGHTLREINSAARKARSPLAHSPASASVRRSAARK
ncbi:hypothetical protein SMALB_3620 [Streptomyces malaysiensis]|uniref:Uncharacterized protein n=1 Tax=Streptomyces malaysiensis TaxID=92644 RepID=A0A7X6AXC9_STRMQ|nr:hypothetical protein [Streptomyces malaysiensis]